MPINPDCLKLQFCTVVTVEEAKRMADIAPSVEGIRFEVVAAEGESYIHTNPFTGRKANCRVSPNGAYVRITGLDWPSIRRFNQDVYNPSVPQRGY